MAVRLFEGKEHAAAYFQYRPTPDELIPVIIGYMEEKKSDRFNLAVDVGCGSGQGTRLLAPYFTKVVGTDISPAQLEMATTNDNPPNVSYRNDCMRIRRMMPLKNFIGIVQSFSMYQLMKQNDAAEAQRVSSDLTNKLLCAMSTSSLDTEVTVVMKYISWMVCKPRSL